MIPQSIWRVVNVVSSNPVIFVVVQQLIMMNNVFHGWPRNFLLNSDTFSCLWLSYTSVCRKLSKSGLKGGSSAKFCYELAVLARKRNTIDTDLFDMLLGGHLSPKSWIYGQILPQIASFLILGTWVVISGIWSILDVFMLKNEENKKTKKSQKFTLDGVRLGC